MPLLPLEALMGRQPRVLGVPAEDAIDLEELGGLMADVDGTFLQTEPPQSYTRRGPDLRKYYVGKQVGALCEDFMQELSSVGELAPCADLRKQLGWARDQGTVEQGLRRNLLKQAAAEIIDFSPVTTPVTTPSSTPVASFRTPVSLPPLPLPAALPRSSPNENALGSLSVLTLNVWVNQAVNNVHAQIEGIRRYDPDVICLQEVFHMQVLNSFRREFPGHVLIAFGRHSCSIATPVYSLGVLVLTTVLFGLVVLLPCLFGYRDWWWLILWPVCMLAICAFSKDHYFVAFLMGNATGLALLVRRSKLELADDSLNGQSFAERCKFSYPEGQAEDFLNALRPRGFLTVTGQVKLNDGSYVQVRVATTHLNQPPVQPKGKGRHRQVKEIFGHCLREGELFILSGDLNATPPGTDSGTSCDTYRSVTEHLVDAWSEKHSSDPNEDGLTWDQETNPMCQTAVNALFYGGEQLRWRCDYVFWRYTAQTTPDAPRVTLRSCEMVLTGAEATGDHYAVLAVYDFYDSKSGICA